MVFMVVMRHPKCFNLVSGFHYLPGRTARVCTTNPNSPNNLELGNWEIGGEGFGIGTFGVRNWEPETLNLKPEN